jgi:hypothetical protein
MPENDILSPRTYCALVSVKSRGKNFKDAVSAIIKVFESIEPKYPGLIVISGTTPDLIIGSPILDAIKVPLPKKKLGPQVLFFISAVTESQRYFALSVISHFFKDSGEIISEIIGTPLSTSGAPVSVRSKSAVSTNPLQNVSYLAYNEKPQKSASSADIVLTFISRVRGTELPVTIELFNSPVAAPIFRSSKELFVIIKAKDIPGISKKKVTLPSALSPAKIITTDRLVPMSITRYLDKAYSLGLLRGATGAKRLESEIAKLFSSIHEVIAGGSIQSQEIKFLTTGSPALKNNLDKMLDDIVKEINSIEKRENSCWFL